MYPDGVDEEDLVFFLVDAKQAQYKNTGEAEPAHREDGGERVVYEDGPYRYLHVWMGVQRFAGHEHVFYRGTPVWALQYYGSDHPRLVDRSELYEFLSEALATVDTTEPFRGPRDYRRGVFRYYNTPDGTVDSFHGQERIYVKGEEAYRLDYRGGSIINES